MQAISFHESASSLKAPTLPTKPLNATSALVGKAYLAAGQAAACLHTMSSLQPYQADLLMDMDDSDEVRADAIRELRCATDLPLRATKEMAKSVGQSMAALVATERHLWLNLFDMKDRDRSVLLDAPLSPSGLFSNTFNSSRGFRRRRNNQRCSRSFFLADLMSPRLLGGSSLGRLRAPHSTECNKSKASPLGFPHIQGCLGGGHSRSHLKIDKI